MVRPVQYAPKKAFTFSKEEQEKYKEIAASVKAKGKDADAKALAEKIQATLAACAKDTVEVPYTDDVPEKDAEFVGFTLGGHGGCGAMAGGELEADTDDIYMEEPRVIAEEEDEVDEEERSLWGDGDDEPGAEAED
mmetsp:Transcript_35545/g.91388  ORF Transcript_35545/g.91388 Transcript_35545/m.91388 type:complete len:136 (-) Transcript_35545:65-472(-)